MKRDFYMPTILKVHPPISGITAHVTMPGRLGHSIISFLHAFNNNNNILIQIKVCEKWSPRRGFQPTTSQS